MANILRQLVGWFFNSFQRTRTDLPEYSELLEIDALLKSKRYEEAKEKLFRFVHSQSERAYPEWTEYVMVAMSVCCLALEEFDYAVSFFSDYIQRHPRESSALRARGAAHWYSNRLNESLEDYSEALSLSPRSVLTLNGRGQVLAELGRSREALYDLRQALEQLRVQTDVNVGTANREIEAYLRNGIASALLVEGDVEGAMIEFENSISLEPDNAWVYFNRGRAFDKANKLDAAYADYQRAIEKRDPPLPPYKRALAIHRLAQMKPS